MTETDDLDENRTDEREKKNNRAADCLRNRFSATAAEAVDTAAAMARRLETRLLLVHVDELYRSLVSDLVIVEAAVLQTRSELDPERRRLRDLSTEIEEKVLADSAFDQLVTAATLPASSRVRHSQ